MSNTSFLSKIYKAGAPSARSKWFIYILWNDWTSEAPPCSGVGAATLFRQRSQGHEKREAGSHDELFLASSWFSVSNATRAPGSHPSWVAYIIEACLMAKVEPMVQFILCSSSWNVCLHACMIDFRWPLIRFNAKVRREIYFSKLAQTTTLNHHWNTRSLLILIPSSTVKLNYACLFQCEIFLIYISITSLRVCYKKSYIQERPKLWADSCSSVKLICSNQLLFNLHRRNIQCIQLRGCACTGHINLGPCCHPCGTRHLASAPKRSGGEKKNTKRLLGYSYMPSPPPRSCFTTVRGEEGAVVSLTFVSAPA